MYLMALLARQCLKLIAVVAWWASMQSATPWLGQGDRLGAGVLGWSALCWWGVWVRSRAVSSVNLSDAQGHQVAQGGVQPPRPETEQVKIHTWTSGGLCL